VGQGPTYITTFGTEKVTNMPLGSACHHDLAFDRGLAAFAPGAEHFMEI
jgi:hypothetical protein